MIALRLPTVGVMQPLVLSDTSTEGLVVEAIGPNLEQLQVLLRDTLAEVVAVDLPEEVTRRRVELEQRKARWRCATTKFPSAIRTHHAHWA